MKCTSPRHSFDELAEEGEVTIAQPQGIPLHAWEDLEGNKADLDHSAQTSTKHPHPSKKQKTNKKTQ